MTETTVRPMGIGQILDAGVRLARERFATLALCAAAIAVPLTIVETAVLAASDPAAFDASVTPDGSVTAGWIAANLVGVVAVLLVLAACLRALSGTYLGDRPATAADSLRFAFRRLPALLGVYVLVAVSVMAGFMLLVVPGIYLGVALALTLPALLFERVGPAAAYGRSLALVQGHWWRTLGTLLVTALVLAGLAVAVSTVIGGLLGSWWGDGPVLAAVRVTVVNVVLAIVLYPLAGAILTVLYYDLRARHEGTPAAAAQPQPTGFGPSGRWAPPRSEAG